MYQKLILAGGTGYLGTVLARHFRFNCREIVILTRRRLAGHDNVRYVEWDGRTAGDWCTELEGADAVVNLCGKEVDCRYTPVAQAGILRSRLEPTRAIGSAIRACSTAPKLWINLASATIYRHAEDRPQTESDGEYGSGFSVDVCRAWEAAFFEAETPATRKVALRTSFVLGRSGGAFAKLRGLVLAGLGGHQGNGRQKVSWIHEQDFARIVEWLLEQPGADGAYNISTPKPVNNRELMRTIRKAYNIPFGISSPAWLLGIGARIIGTEPELILKSRWVLPARLEAEGFRFYYENLEPAINDIAGTRL
ncbi:TIGR01777 family protein [Flaviaesturariibacter flavus]|uniref:TIGR01777 family protein n=1 Tax=Flaviaesturariibacter flavus TaxID=2502780 RepID=A0A4R1BNN9_9BACT|nr:TIGR01777 family oxidoreductase [Flaviaesturariibacter flavus]TCJ19018.1 TIGR01777 family protein [Flaviaesturariibacter flavus]